MALKLISRPAYPIAILFAATILCALGCGKAEQIQTYTVPKEPKFTPVAEVTDVKPGEPTDRMLAAILPSGEQAWFFKAVGPIAEIDKHEKEINDFFTALTIVADGKANWKLPAGWKEEAGTGIRTATIVIPGDKRLEITVNTTPWPGTEEGMLLNVNRWRGQLQLPPITAKQLPDVTHEAKAGDKPITIVDLRGQFKPGGMTPPFAGAFGPRATGAPGKAPTASDNLPAGHPPIDSSAQSPGGLPPGHPPLDANGTQLPDPAAENSNPAANTSPPPDVLPKFDLPSGWKQVPTGPFRLADFTVGEGAQAPHLSVSQFPAGAPMIADPMANINRWRGEIGLKPIEKDAVAAATQTIEVDGKPVTIAQMIPNPANPEESQAKEATLAAIVKSGDQVWFFKMRGSRDDTPKHQDEFKAFLKSLKFSRDNETGHGNK
jgi:hypothetical protein